MMPGHKGTPFVAKNVNSSEDFKIQLPILHGTSLRRKKFRSLAVALQPRVTVFFPGQNRKCSRQQHFASSVENVVVK
jgi:hypothetical protein